MPSHKYAIGWILFSIFLLLSLFWLFRPLHYPPDFDYPPSFPPHQQGPFPHHPSRPLPVNPGPDASIWVHRQKQVREAFVHALSGYKKHAFPNDELLSISGRSSNKFNGWSVTLLDSMDTMWIMGLHGEFDNALRVVASQNFTHSFNVYAPFFETTIRYLGGLLSSYALSHEPILLARADDLARLLLPVFDATPSGLPAYSVNTQTGHTGHGWLGDSVLFSEATSCQLEFKYLAKLTGRKEYYDKVEHVMDLMYNASTLDGLFSLTWSPQGAPRANHYSVGASADSGYEYLLKQYLLTGDKKALSQYLKSISGILNNLFYLTPNRNLLYVTDIQTSSSKSPSPSHKLEHLSCFLPGVLALGAHLLPETIDGHIIFSAKDRERHMWAAKGLGYTCWVSYADSASGLGPDGLRMNAKGGEKWVDALKKWDDGGRKGHVPGLGKVGGEGGRDYTGDAGYYLRPETIESMYVLWKTTGEYKWRERSWKIFESIEKYAKTEYGYASVDKVDTVPPRLIDDMPSYFLAETLKYLYLMFDESEAGLDPYPLEKWVFNTEAHPLPVFSWTEWEREWYGIEKHRS